jgi:mono/diheme cytochrome c family protein
MTSRTHFTNRRFALAATGLLALALPVLGVSAPPQQASKPLKPLGQTVPPTYAADVAPILNRSCVSCHRPGEVGPFALGSYEQAKKWAPMIAQATQSGHMPPWKAAPGFGEFHGDRSLGDKERAILAAWVKAGAPSGDLRRVPPAPKLPPVGAWPAGQPDLVIAPTQAYSVPAEGGDEYRCFVLPTEFTGDAYVKLSQVKPGARSVVHHVILYADPSGTRGIQADDADPQPGFANPRAGAGPPVNGAFPVAAWVPGSTPRPYPSGIAARIPKGSRLILEVHYHPTGKTEQDQTRVGLTFARDTVDQVLTGTAVAQPFLNLPPGESRIPVKSRVTIPQDMSLLLIAPHMHYIGREMHVWAELPSDAPLSEPVQTVADKEGKAVTPVAKRIELIWIKNWDFNWQDGYWFKKPVRLPKGTTVHMEATFDNSAQNPRNPHNPPKRLHWGEASSDEMCLAALGGVRDGEKLGITPAPWQSVVK